VPELVKALEFARDQGLPTFLLGWGSNLLVLDGGVRGLVLRLKGEFDHIERIDETKVWAGAAVRLPRLVVYCATRGLTGAEPMVGVPGTVGGSLVMNAGTREGEMGDIVKEVEMIVGLEPKRIPASAIAFAYRHSSLEGRVLTGAVLELKHGVKPDIMRRIQALQKRRQETQPIHSRNVGSVFKNPPGHFVAKLIEDSGLKGFRVGGAVVSTLHANFIDNTHGASARDVQDLISIVRGRVREKTGVDLELEVKIVGEA
jgi:UDP-N-acetylmuramate dehydrogenase